MTPSDAHIILGWAKSQRCSVAAACLEHGGSYAALCKLAKADEEVGYLLEQVRLQLAVPLEEIELEHMKDPKAAAAARRAYLARHLPDDHGVPESEDAPARQQVNVLVQIASDRIAGARHDGQGYVPAGLDVENLKANDKLKMLEPKAPAPEVLELPDLAELEGAPF